jgi:hypothetical protein
MQYNISYFYWLIYFILLFCQLFIYIISNYNGDIISNNMNDIRFIIYYHGLLIEWIVWDIMLKFFINKCIMKNFLSISTDDYNKNLLENRKYWIFILIYDIFLWYNVVYAIINYCILL